MRFRKSIKIGKGMRINFSKSGISSSFGIKGLSTTIGKKGIYLNAGIPGTGLSTRHKIIGTSSSKSKKSSCSNHLSHAVLEEIKVTFSDNGEIQFYDSLGNIVTDQSKIRKVKSTEQFKAWKAEKMQDQYDKVNGETDKIITIHSLSPTVLREEEYIKMLKNIVLQTYKKERYSIERPTESHIIKILEREAVEKIKTWKIWTLSRERKKYVQTNLEQALKTATEKWQDEKAIFDKKQEQIAQIRNQKYKEQYDLKVNEINHILNGNNEFIVTAIEKWLKTVVLPVDFALQFEYDDGTLWLDLDLPEIEDLPNEKAVMLASGTTKVKSKTQKEKKEDYINCVFGLAIFFSANLYNISPKIKQIVISGYTQRSSNKTTAATDEYVYSIKFVRSKFEGKNFEKIALPFDFCMEFENRCIVTSTLILKKIEPFEQ